MVEYYFTGRELNSTECDTVLMFSSAKVYHRPVPDFSEPFRPQLPHVTTQAAPFSFENRTQEMFRRKQEKIEKVLQEEEEVVILSYLT